jgi:hypothetical protein
MFRNTFISLIFICVYGIQNSCRLLFARIIGINIAITEPTFPCLVKQVRYDTVPYGQDPRLDL